MSLRHIADTTKLAVSTLEALERGNVSRLPGGIYRRAIVRSFAREVGLDPEETLQEFLAQYPDDLPPPPSSAPAVHAVAAAEPVRPARRWLLQAAVKLLGAAVPVLAGFYYFGATTPSSATRQVEHAFPERPTDVWSPEIVPAGGFSEAPPPALHPVVVRLTASSSCVLRVSADGRLVLARTISAGEQLEVELSDELLLSGDDARAVQFSINGQAGRLLGEAGEPFDVRIGREDYQRWLVAHR